MRSWSDRVTGIMCHSVLDDSEILKNRTWFCGYVEVPEDHPLIGEGTSRINLAIGFGDWGEISFADELTIYERGEARNVWCIGFDTAMWKKQPTREELEKVCAALAQIILHFPEDESVLEERMR